MGVHDIASYVKFHQQKLRDQQAQEQAASQPKPKPIPRKKGVDTISSKAAFDDITKGANTASDSPSVILVDAFATWCGPCKVIAPKIVELSNGDEYGGKVGFYKFDVDNVPELAQELGVRAMPTFFVVKDGEVIDQVVGANLKGIQASLDKALAA